MTNVAHTPTGRKILTALVLAASALVIAAQASAGGGDAVDRYLRNGPVVHRLQANLDGDEAGPDALDRYLRNNPDGAGLTLAAANEPVPDALDRYLRNGPVTLS